MECKSGSRASELLRFTELIDTLWNVNNLDMRIQQGLQRINRYIMECKSKLFHCFYLFLQELIDTLWNVNSKMDFDCVIDSCKN